MAFSRLIWLTYRRNFAPLLVEKNKVPKLTTDAGWGCVIRCTQMLLANSLQSLVAVGQGIRDDDRNRIL